MNVDADLVIDTVARATGLSFDAVYRGRSEPAVEARRWMWKALRDAGMALTAIGDLTDHDHTTVMAGLERLEGDPPQWLPKVARLTEGEKTCSRCAEKKPLTEFYRHRRNTGDGYQAYCKTCNKEHKSETRRRTHPSPRRGVRLRQVNVNLSVEAHKAAKAAAEMLGVSMAVLIEESLAFRLRAGWCVVEGCRDSKYAAGKCTRHFAESRTPLPSRSELEDAHRRRLARERKRVERARRAS